MTHAKTILVMGATGQQGGATARCLLAQGWKVRALTRDPASLRAQALARLGAELVQGDMDQPGSLDQAMQGVYGVFSVQPPSWAPTPASDALEARRGIAVVDAAIRAGVQHLVYTSALAADQMASFRPQFKYSVEAHLWQSKLPGTILRPAGFMENFFLPQMGLAQGLLYDPTPADIPLPLIAVQDIGFFAALAFAEPQQFIGQSIDLAGAWLSPSEITSLLSQATGSTVRHMQVPIEQISAQNPLMGELVGWILKKGYPPVDLEALRAHHPGLLSLEDWLAQPEQAGLKA